MTNAIPFAAIPANDAALTHEYSTTFDAGDAWNQTVYCRFAVSNVTQADLDALHEHGMATVEIDGYYPSSDTTGTAHLNVSNWLCSDSIGRAGSRQEEAAFQVQMVKRDGRWMVRMEGLPRNEKQSRD